MRPAVVLWWGRVRWLWAGLALVLLALALALLPLPYAVVLVGAAIGGVLVALDPLWALCLVVLSVPVQEWVLLPGGLSVTQAALILVVGSWGLHTLAHPERRVPLGWLFPPLVLLVWALALAALTSPYSRAEGFRETLRWATVLLMYVMTLTSLYRARQPETWRVLLLVGCLLLAPVSAALIGLWQFVTATGPPSFEIIGGRFVRAYGPIGQPNSFAGYINMGWPIAVALSLAALLRLRVATNKQLAFGVFAVAGGAAVILVAALGASFSRGGWLGALAGGVVVAAALVTLFPAALRGHIWRWVAGAVAVGVVALVVAGNLLPQSVTQRATSITQNLRLFDPRSVSITAENFAVVERMAHLQAGWNMFTRHPLTGVGPGNFTLAYEHQPSREDPAYAVRPWYESRGHAHNYYLHMAAEAGLIGAGAYLLLIGTLVVRGLLALRRERTWLQQGILIGGVGVGVAVAAHNLFENLHVLNFGLQLGAVWALIDIATRDEAEPSSVDSL